MSAEQNAVEGLSEGEQELLIQAFFPEPDFDCVHNMVPVWEVVEAIIAARVRLAVDEFAGWFPQWVASNRAYNGSDWPHGQSLYNECLNAVLSDWAAHYLSALREQGGAS